MLRVSIAFASDENAIFWLPTAIASGAEATLRGFVVFASRANATIRGFVVFASRADVASRGFVASETGVDGAKWGGVACSSRALVSKARFGVMASDAEGAATGFVARASGGEETMRPRGISLGRSEETPPCHAVRADKARHDEARATAAYGSAAWGRRPAVDTSTPAPRSLAHGTMRPCTFGTFGSRTSSSSATWR